jgi:hypothetical protein
MYLNSGYTRLSGGRRQMFSWESSQFFQALMSDVFFQCFEVVSGNYDFVGSEGEDQSFTVARILSDAVNEVHPG